VSRKGAKTQDNSHESVFSSQRVRKGGLILPCGPKYQLSGVREANIANTRNYASISKFEILEVSAGRVGSAIFVIFYSMCVVERCQ